MQWFNSLTVHPYSVGIAPNRMLAKVCSDRNKPNGQVAVILYREGGCTGHEAYLTTALDEYYDSAFCQMRGHTYCPLIKQWNPEPNYLPCPSAPLQYELPSTLAAVRQFVAALEIRKVPGVGKVSFCIWVGLI